MLQYLPTLIAVSVLYPDGSCIAECVRVLALMPKEVAGKWRGRVLQMALVTH